MIVPDHFEFSCRGDTCRGEVNLPQGEDRPPAVIMAHGLSFDRTLGLTPYAERFCREGYAVFVFDYRGFGDSDGEPRRLVDPNLQLEDWAAAIACVRGRADIDPARIALWGTSFAGGHVVKTAAAGQPVAAIIAQVPFLDIFSTLKKLGLRHVLRAVPHVLRDATAALLGARPHEVRVIGTPDEFAVIDTPGSRDAVLRLVPPGSPWKNRCPARILAKILFYRPLAAAPRVTCPALLIYGEHDNIIDAGRVRQAAAAMPAGRAVPIPAGHFDVYQDEPLTRVLEAECRFLEEVFSGRQPASQA
ncbi:MAG: alpha/beta fold hydrolase [Paracoccaceae bacterium]